MELALKIIGMFLGVLARTYVPYLRKLKEGKETKFKKCYTLSTVASLVLGLIITLLVFPQFDIAKAGVGLEASIKLFCLAFGFGFGWNSIVSETIKWTTGGKN
ncbi:MAG TPA: hypothetical protein VGB16_05845 [candidate division Zixibacteria bacterium]